VNNYSARGHSKHCTQSVNFAEKWTSW